MAQTPVDSVETKLTYRFADLALVFLGILTVYAKTYEYLLRAIDSSIYAGLSMNVTGQGLIPHLPMGLEIHGGLYGTHGFNDHPGLLLYVSGWVMRLLGPEAWTARLVPCMMSAACIPILYALGKQWGSRLRGWTAGAVLALTIVFFRNASGFQLDAPMIFFILLSFFAWEKGWAIRTGIFAGLAIVVKAPVGLLIFPVSLLTYFIVEKFGQEPNLPRGVFFRRWFAGLTVCLLIVAGFWAICAALGGFGLVTDYWGRYVFGTLQGRDNSQAFDGLMYFRTVIGRYWPWLPFFLYGLYDLARSGDWKKRAELVPVLALVIVVAIVSLIKFKSGGHYFLPAYPFMAWITARPLARWIAKSELVFLQRASAFIFIATLALVCFPIHLHPDALPALKKFNAFIQSEGTPQDRVLYVNGEFPFGSSMDYLPVINFYTGRQVDVKDCSSANTTIEADPRIKWVIVAGANYEKCITGSTRDLFPTTYRMEKVYLLSKQVRTKEIDLTPLRRELKAATDGKAAPLKADIYH